MNKRQKQLINTYFRKREIAIKQNLDQGTIYDWEFPYYNESIQTHIIINYNIAEEYINYLSENAQIATLELNPRLIKYINNPSEKLQKYVIKKQAENILFINNPTDNMKIYALFNYKHVNYKYFLLSYVDKNPSEELTLLADVLGFPYHIRKIENPSEIIQLAAIHKSDSMIHHIKNPTKKVKEKALKSDPSTILFINNITYYDFKYIYDNHYDVIENFLKPDVLPQIKNINQTLYQHLIKLL
jgi:hypothetical protein